MNKIYEEVSKETGLPKFMVEKLYKYTFKFLKEKMEADEMKGLMIPGFGKFVVKDGRKKHFEKIWKESLNSEQQK